jgi:hypothetical protein
MQPHTLPHDLTYACLFMYLMYTAYLTLPRGKSEVCEVGEAWQSLFHPSSNPSAWKILKEFQDDAGEVQTLSSRKIAVSVNVGLRRGFQPYPR